ncbi:hypothetical protein Ancab_036739 [Ancistrocladus abbreviatus]
MTLLFRSKSSRFAGHPSLKYPGQTAHSIQGEDKDDAEEGEEEEDIEDEECSEEFEFEPYNPTISTPFIRKEREEDEDEDERDSGRSRHHSNHHQFPILAVLAAALRKSIVTCSVEREDISSVDISWPTDVKHISHVTFDRFDGFLGLPVELQLEVPRRVPSASVSVFGVSPQSMQCSIDRRGNSVPTLLLMMQKRLYLEGGLQAEGIFRINAENSQEESVRSRLNRGQIPRGIDVHCLAGLIKAWFRELPAGVLDSLTPEQVMHCNTESQCTQLVKLLPPTEAGLLDWAINLMADVVQNEQHNKMNARNIAMVFAPNMTQMADPLTALIHAVQVMNILKTLIMMTLREREEYASRASLSSSFSNSLSSTTHPDPSTPNYDMHPDRMRGSCGPKQPASNTLLRTVTLGRLEFITKQKQLRLEKKLYDEDGKLYASISGGSSPAMCKDDKYSGTKSGEVEGMLERLNFRKGVKKLCRHPVFQLSKPVKKNGGLGIVNNGDRGGRETWA